MHQQNVQPPPTKHVTMVLRECGICQSSIYPSEQTTVCPKCGLTFHAECWQENMGCAAYGCEQVDVLKPKSAEQALEELPAPIVQPAERLPWDFLLLGAAAIGLMASALAFGVPSLIVAGGVGWRACKRNLIRDPKKFRAEPILAAAAILAIVGIIAGIGISWFWWRLG
jgi:hypothetical protein